MLLAVPFVVYAAFAAWRSELHLELVLLALIAVVLNCTGRRARELFVGLAPLGLIGLVYDAMRPRLTRALDPSRVHVCDVRDLEARFFGLEDGGGRITLHDWFLVHHSTPLDLLCAFPYATFLLMSVVCVIYLHVVDRPAMSRFAWAFFLVNIAGFVTYRLLPAAPPWYFHANGCAVDLSARASEGPALARVDALLGTTFFREMYARASSVYGAIPSLHCAYPLIVVIEGWRSFGTKLRCAAVGYWMLMVFSAVYLDHHWVIDAITGSVYALTAVAIVRVASRERLRARLLRRFAYVVSVWFGCGLSPIAPGTIGSLGALPIYFVVRGGGPIAIACAALVMIGVGVWASGIVATRLSAKDPQIIVIDEVAGTLVALAIAPPSFAGVASAFALFRLFDIAKPFPARRAEKLPGGWGIMADDVVAGVQAAAVIALLRGARVI
jgi:phosphatidylglycerophosphatase A